MYEILKLHKTCLFYLRMTKISYHLNFLSAGLETLIACRTFITDAGLSSVVRHLPRLSHLDVEGCASLTSQGIVNFPTFCQNLRFLNVSFCLKIKTFVVEDVRRKISSLHKVEMRGLHIAECLDEN